MYTEGDILNQLTSLFKVLSDETRLRMLILLFSEDMCVCQLSGVLDVSQPKISKNLSKLRDINLVTDQRKEKFVYYSLNTDNKLLNAILKDILENIKNYPLISHDLLRVKDKEKYLSECDRNNKN